MKFDLSQLNELKGLDLEDLGSWPPIAKVLLVVFMAIGVTVLSFKMLVSDKIDTLEAAKTEVGRLKQEFTGKYHASANLEIYKQQMIEAEEQFSNLLKRLPSKHEIPGLLDDITYVGTTSGLSFLRINWEPEIEKEFYTELPINIEVVGKYHDFGNFVSKVAALPRIVTVHNFDLKNHKDEQGNLVLKMQAKTYRYREVKQ